MKKIALWLLVSLLAGGWMADRYLLMNSPTPSPSSSSEWHALFTGNAEDAWEVYDIESLLKKRSASGRPYLPFIDRSSLKCGIYVLEAGATDSQQPHQLDEVYYTLSGKASFTVEGEEMQVAPGTVLFVQAGAQHHFHDIEEELSLLVFFSSHKE